MGRIAKLIMVTENNNNKFYSMFEQTDGTFKVEYGRVDSTKQTTSYPIHQWDKKFNEKVKKGYKDVTEFTTVKEDASGDPVDETFISNDTYVKSLIEDLQKWAKATVSQNYNVSTRNVTQKMVDEAQMIINQISTSYSNKASTKELNELLLKLFTIIPRKMSKVSDYMLTDNSTKEQISKLIDEEQSLLDTLAGQVAMEVDQPKQLAEESKKKTKGLLDTMGIEVSYVTDANVITKIKKLMGDSSHLFHRVYEVKNFKTEKAYKGNKIENEELLWHGSRNQNFFNILQTGLLIRPSCAVYTGSMFGDGIYFANKARKSIGYTSLSGSYWAGGSANKAYLTIFAVNLGKKKDVYKHTYECSKFSNKTIAPYNSVFAHGGIDLRNDELIVYSADRCTVRYMVEIKN